MDVDNTNTDDRHVRTCYVINGEFDIKENPFNINYTHLQGAFEAKLYDDLAGGNFHNVVYKNGDIEKVNFNDLESLEIEGEYGNEPVETVEGSVGLSDELREKMALEASGFKPIRGGENTIPDTQNPDTVSDKDVSVNNVSVNNVSVNNDSDKDVSDNDVPLTKYVEKEFLQQGASVLVKKRDFNIDFSNKLIVMSLDNKQMEYSDRKKILIPSPDISANIYLRFPEQIVSSFYLTHGEKFLIDNGIDIEYLEKDKNSSLKEVYVSEQKFLGLPFFKDVVWGRACGPQGAKENFEKDVVKKYNMVKKIFLKWNKDVSEKITQDLEKIDHAAKSQKNVSSESVQKGGRKRSFKRKPKNIKGKKTYCNKNKNMCNNYMPKNSKNNKLKKSKSAKRSLKKRGGFLGGTLTFAAQHHVFLKKETEEGTGVDNIKKYKKIYDKTKERFKTYVSTSWKKGWRHYFNANMLNIIDQKEYAKRNLIVLLDNLVEENFNDRNKRNINKEGDLVVEEVIMIKQQDGSEKYNLSQSQRRRYEYTWGQSASVDDEHTFSALENIEPNNDDNFFEANKMCYHLVNKNNTAKSDPKWSNDKDKRIFKNITQDTFKYGLTDRGYVSKEVIKPYACPPGFDTDPNKTPDTVKSDIEPQDTTNRFSDAYQKEFGCPEMSMYKTFPRLMIGYKTVDSTGQQKTFIQQPNPPSGPDNIEGGSNGTGTELEQITYIKQLLVKHGLMSEFRKKFGTWYQKWSSDNKDKESDDWKRSYEIKDSEGKDIDCCYKFTGNAIRDEYLTIDLIKDSYYEKGKDSANTTLCVENGEEYNQVNFPDYITTSYYLTHGEKFLLDKGHKEILSEGPLGTKGTFNNDVAWARGCSRTAAVGNVFSGFTSLFGVGGKKKRSSKRRTTKKRISIKKNKGKKGKGKGKKTRRGKK
jgi:hypothetical protein